MMSNSRSLLVGALILALYPLAGCSRAESPRSATPPTPIGRTVDLAHHFPNVDAGDAAFVLMELSSGALIRFDTARSAARLIPASTFKIANALIALETGVADGPDFALPWDGRQGDGFWSPAWSRDHTLATAMRQSVVWYYQELARRIGPERMQAYLDRFDYGNRSMSGGIDQFWLRGGLRISADEQVLFLRRLLSGELDVSPGALAALRSALLLEDGIAHRLSGKTGTVSVTPTRELAWLVGFVERGEHTWLFALNVEGEQVWEQWGPPAARLALVRAILQELQVLPME
jgi:beta-lactamase class D